MREAVRKILWENTHSNQGGSWFDLDTALEAILALVQKPSVTKQEVVRVTETIVCTAKPLTFFFKWLADNGVEVKG